MYQPKATDAKQPTDNDVVALLVGSYDPATLDYLRAAEALLARPDVQHVWITPIGSSSDAKAMASSLSIEISTVTRRPAAFCSVGLDKKIVEPEVLAGWCRSKYPTLKFDLASIDVPTKSGFWIKFASQQATDGELRRVVALDKHLPAGDVVTRIRGGSDESRWFTPAIWGIIQNRRLYR